MIQTVNVVGGNVKDRYHIDDETLTRDWKETVKILETDKTKTYSLIGHVTLTLKEMTRAACAAVQKSAAAKLVKWFVKDYKRALRISFR